MKQRSINTNMWEDGYFQSLEPIEKLFFTFLLTNPATNVAGIYEITTRTMVFLTGLKEIEVMDILNKFEADKKVFYVNDYIIMVNHLRHQKLNHNMHKGVETIISNLKTKVVNSKGFELYSEIYKGNSIRIELP